MERKIIIYRNNATHTEEMTGDVSNLGQLKQLFSNEGIDYAKYDIYKIWGGKSECITNEINSYAFPDTVSVGRSNKQTSDLYFSLVKKDKNIDTARSTSMVKLDRREAQDIIRDRGLEVRFASEYGKHVTNCSNDELYMFLYKNGIDIHVVDLKKNGAAILRDIVDKKSSDYEKPVVEERIAEKRLEREEKEKAFKRKRELEEKYCSKKISGSAIMTVDMDITPAAAVIALYNLIDEEEQKKVREYITSIGEAMRDDKEDYEEDNTEEDINSYLMEMTRNIVK